MYTLCHHYRLFAGDVKAIAAGYYHSMVLKTDGNVWVTGENNNGQLGDGSDIDKDTFVLVIGTWDIALGKRAIPLST